MRDAALEVATGDANSGCTFTSMREEAEAIAAVVKAANVTEGVALSATADVGREILDMVGRNTGYRAAVPEDCPALEGWVRDRGSGRLGPAPGDPGHDAHG